jgi:hypothetical protein|nr:MAG TPA: hypothetical protein [Caudoviricetes sp.]
MDFSQYNIQYGNLQTPQNINPYMSNGMDVMMHAPEQKPDIDQFLYKFNDQHREKFNDFWFTRNDDDIIEGMKQVILSCERDKYFIIKVIGFEVIKDYEEIQKILYNYYSMKTKNGKKVSNEYDYITLRDSDIMLLKVRYYIKLNIPESKIRIDPKTGELEKSEGELEVLIILPIYVNKYYFRILGNYYNPIFQIVDGSTYNNSTSNSKVQSITLKTQFMPIKVYKESYDIMDIVDGTVHRCVLFTSYIFNKKTDSIKFILGRYGLYGAEEMLELNGIYTSKGDASPMDPNVFYNFTDPHHKIIVSVIKRLFDKDNVTQSFVYTILKSVKKLENFDDIYDPRYWNRMLGADFQSATLDKGIPVLDSFESIYDIRTKQSIKLPPEDKEDSYCILRWMMREFSFLKARDNMDISTKHPRQADEYLPAIYAMKISRGLYRISDKGKNVTFKDVVRVLDTPPNYILKNINAANLVDYVDLVNDNDAELAISYTYKGISGLGDQGSGTAVPIVYRFVHPSQLGRVDLDASSSSDPGLSGLICPMAKINNGSFTDYKEPNGWKQFYLETMSELRSLYGMQQAIDLKKRCGLSYDYVKEDMVRETIESYHRLIPAIIDIDGKKDYTLGVKLSETTVSKGDDDGVGDVTTDVEIPPSAD